MGFQEMTGLGRAFQWICIMCTWDEDEAKFIYTRVCKLNDLHGFNHGK